MLELGRPLWFFTVGILLVACTSGDPAESNPAKTDAAPAARSDVSLSVRPEVEAGGEISGFAGSSHPPVIVYLESEAGKMLPTVGLGSPDERSTSFQTEVPRSYEHDFVVVTARDGTGKKIVKKVRVIRR